MIVLFAGALVILVLGLLLLFILHTSTKNLGMLNKETISIDNGITPGSILYSQTIPLIGKPDYLIKYDGIIYPVEVKSGNTPSYPHQNHIMQLMAYCYLVEEIFDLKLDHGYIRYSESNKEFKIAYTPQRKKQLIQLVNEILQCKQNNKEFTCDHSYHNAGITEE